MFLVFVGQILKRAKIPGPGKVNFAIYREPDLVIKSVSLFVLCPELFNSLSIHLVSRSILSNMLA